MTLPKKILTVIMALLICMCITVAVIETGKSNADGSLDSLPKAAEADANAESYLYRVTEYNGKIAVFSQNAKTPLYILDSPYVRDLPEHDRELLRLGIIAESNTRLLEILEDYDN